MNNEIQKEENKSLLRWQKITSMCTLFLALSAIAAIIVTIHYNNKLIRESIESRVAENRPLIDIRKYPELGGRKDANFHLEIKNVGKGNAYNINYSYHYYDFGTKEIIWEFGETHSGEVYFTVLEPGKVLNFYTEEDRRRFNIPERDGLPFIFAVHKQDEIKRMIDSTFVGCAVYVEYEDFKGNVFWSGRQFGIMNRPLPSIQLAMQYDRQTAKARGSFMKRARERVVKGIHDFEGLQMFEKADLMQTEKLEDTLKEKDLK